MKTRTTFIASTLIAASLVSGAAQAALFDRGGGLIYDDVLNVTWLQDANYAKTSGYDADGLMTWNEANAWAANLSYFDTVRNVTYTDWRLPTVEPVNGISFNYAFQFDGSTDIGYNTTGPSNEMAYMHYVNLGNLGYYTSTGVESGCYGDTCLDTSGPFSNIQPFYSYWSDTEQMSDSTRALVFAMGMGARGSAIKSNNNFAWAVRPGDVAAVPEADAWAMLLAGLGLVGAAVRRRKHAMA